MFYFYFRFILSSFITAALFIFFLSSVKKYRKEKCSKAVQIFYPFFAAAATILHLWIFSSGMMMDNLMIIRGSLPVQQIEVTSRSAMPGSLKTKNEEIYTYNPFEKPFAPGNSYIISFTPNRHFVISVSKVEK